LWRALVYQLELTFFGLIPAYKPIFMAEVHDLVYHGGGGFIYSEVYNMPIQTRKFHIRKINDHIEKQNEEYEKTRKGSQITNSKQLARPNISQADFTTSVKAPKK